MSTNGFDKSLNEILQKSQSISDYKLLPEELVCLTSAFLSSQDDISTIRPKGYVVLSALCQKIHERKGNEKDLDRATKDIVSTFGPTVLEHLKETNEKSLLTGVTFLTALFQVDVHAASSIFVEDGLMENLMDSVDLSPSNLLCQEVAHLLGQACGHKPCRAVITSQIQRWLEFKSQQTSDAVLQSAATVALIKLAKGAATDDPENATPDSLELHAEDMTTKLVDVILSDKSDSYGDAIEGIAYLSTEPVVKERLSRNLIFLKKLYSLVPAQKTGISKVISVTNPTLIFGIVLILSNLSSFRPHLTEEQKQVEKLKQMAKAGKNSVDNLKKTKLDDDDHVRVRIRLLVASGILPVFPAAIAASDSPAVRALVGKSLLSIIEEKDNRGKILQAGGAKVLQSIIKRAAQTKSTSKKQPDLSPSDLEAIQALAKLAITSSPVQVFGPDVGVLYDAIRPFSSLLQHPSSTMLQRFEAIMALTNLASHSPDVATRIAKADGLFNRVELLLLEDHTLIRRASVELICNLIAGSEDAFERYSGETPNSASKIHVLLALTDEEDIPTRLAASGALATIAMVPTACIALVNLQFEKHRFFALMTQLIDPSVLQDEEKDEDSTSLQTNPGLVHRGVVCVRNVFRSVTDDDIRKRLIKEATEYHLLEALARLTKGQGVVKDQAIVQQGAEALKSLISGTS